MSLPALNERLILYFGKKIEERMYHSPATSDYMLRPGSHDYEQRIIYYRWPVTENNEPVNDELGDPIPGRVAGDIFDTWAVPLIESSYKRVCDYVDPDTPVRIVVTGTNLLLFHLLSRQTRLSQRFSKGPYVTDPWIDSSRGHSMLASIESMPTVDYRSPFRQSALRLSGASDYLYPYKRQGVAIIERNYA